MYVIMEDKDIEQVFLWEKYLSYAVSFGITSKIMKRIQGLYLDDDLLGLLNNEEFNYFITSDYYTFYKYASLDTRFMISFKHFTNNMFASGGGSSGSSSGGSSFGSSSGGGRCFFWWWRILWWSVGSGGGGRCLLSCKKECSLCVSFR